MKEFNGLFMSDYGNIKDADNATLLHDAYVLADRINWEKGKQDQDDLRLYDRIMNEIKSR